MVGKPQGDFVHALGISRNQNRDLQFSPTLRSMPIHDVDRPRVARHRLSNSSPEKRWKITEREKVDF
jgi:hypothetical protein